MFHSHDELSSSTRRATSTTFTSSDEVMRLCQHDVDDDESVLVSLQPPQLIRPDDSDDSIVLPTMNDRRVQRGGTIDTTPGSDQVENFRPRHFLRGPESPSHLLPAHGYLQFHTRRGSVLEKDGEVDISTNGNTNPKSMNKAAVDTERQKSRDLADTFSNKFCGFSFPTTALDIGVDDMSLCCDGMYIRDKLKCLFEASTPPTNDGFIHKTLSNDDETCPVDSETVHSDTLAVGEQDVSTWNDPFINSTPKRFHHKRLPDSYTVNGTNEYEESTVTSTGSEETSRTAVSKSPRRLRLARLHKQRMHQQQQHIVSNHPLSIP